MNCVAYFDLLGTKGFCEDRELYFKNITEFYKAIKQLSAILDNSGKVGVFSDCAYAEASDINVLLDFLTTLRDRLSAKKLFFNAVVKRGELGTRSAESGNNNLFGVVFEKNLIADIYITHSNFKGIGIYIDEKLLSNSKIKSDYKIVKSAFVYKDKVSNTNSFKVKGYYDVAINEIAEPRYSNQEAEILDILLRQWLQAHSKSPKYGSYYISIFITLLRSYKDPEFKWNSDRGEFDQCPYTIKILFDILSGKFDDFEDFIGIENIALTILDVVYSDGSLSPDDKINITSKFMSFPCIKRKYRHSLEEIPKEVFVVDGNREKLIRNCQEEIANDVVSKYVKPKTLQGS